MPPLIQWGEEFILPKQSRFSIEEKEFLAGSRTAVALDKMGSFYLRNEFRKDARKFLEELTSTVLSAVAAGSDLGQGLSCFCPEIVIGGMTMPRFHLFGQLMDGLIEFSCVCGSTVEASKDEN